MRWRPWDSSRWLILGLLLVPLLVWSVMWIAQGWIPQGDEGWIALKTHDVFSGHPPLLGMRSTSDQTWPGVSAHHPGPVEFYLLAIPYAATGFRPYGLICGCFLLEAVLVWLAIHHAWQVGRRKAVTAVVVAIACSEVLVGPSLVLPWNPWPPVIGSVALLVLAWRLLLGHRRVLPWFVAVGSLVLQANLAFVAFLAPLLLVLVGVGVLRAISSRGTGADSRAAWWRNPVLWAVLVGLLLWSPALVELFAVSPNNASQLWAIGSRVLRDPLHVVAVVCLLFGCGWIAWRVRRGFEEPVRSTVRWVSLLFAAGIVGSLAGGGAARAIYLVMAVGAFVFAIAVWCERLPARNWARTVPPAGWAILGVLVAVCIGPWAPGALYFTRAETQAIDRTVPAVHEVMGTLHAHGVHGGAVVVRAEGVLAVGNYQTAVIAQLAADGYAPYFDTAWPRPEDDTYRRVDQAPADAVTVTIRDGEPTEVELPAGG